MARNRVRLAAGADDQVEVVGAGIAGAEELEPREPRQARRRLAQAAQWRSVRRRRGPRRCAASAAPPRCVHQACSHSHVRNGQSAALARSSSFHCGRSAVNRPAVVDALDANSVRAAVALTAARRTALVGGSHHAAILRLQRATPAAPCARCAAASGPGESGSSRTCGRRKRASADISSPESDALVPELERVDAALLQRLRRPRACRGTSIGKNSGQTPSGSVGKTRRRRPGPSCASSSR